MKVVKEEEEQDGDLFDGRVCVGVGGGVVHFSGEKHGKEPERDEDYKVYKHTTGKMGRIEQNNKKP